MIVNVVRKKPNSEYRIPPWEKQRTESDFKMSFVFMGGHDKPVVISHLF